MTLPSQAMTPAEADKIAAAIVPSWHEAFGSPHSGAPSGDPRSLTAKTPSAIAARAAEALDPAPPGRAADLGFSLQPPVASHPLPKAFPASVPPAVAIKSAPPPDFRSMRPFPADLPRSPMPWGMIAAATVGVAALIAAIVVFTGKDEASPARDTASSSNAEPKKSAAPIESASSPTPSPAPPAPKTEEPAPEAPAANPAPEPAQPWPAQPEPAPKAAPPIRPQPTPKAPPPRPTPAPRPKQPQPSPKPKPGSGDIVRKAPF